MNKEKDVRYQYRTSSNQAQSNNSLTSLLPMVSAAVGANIMNIPSTEKHLIVIAGVEVFIVWPWKTRSDLPPHDCAGGIFRFFMPPNGRTRA